LICVRDIGREDDGVVIREDERRKGLLAEAFQVDPVGIEPTTFRMPSERSPS
jgi:hypothetical protein